VVDVVEPLPYCNLEVVGEEEVLRAYHCVPLAQIHYVLGVYDLMKPRKN